ncbi:MinD/ParA family protein [Clostridium hydrogeniformans]|uniref:MinD/ParA family protein n=1 Tax=Clostridium hydrogeniformans TaxID=349933 RepID=UPI000480D87E|nr:MinD/ParA family protein [Clostridium hydrogeniformans]
MLDQAERLRELAYGNKGRNKPRIITITSGKGGVGKSNFVVNLAISLRLMGKKVMIFDADIGMGNDDILMGCNARYNVFDVILNNKDIREVIVEGPLGVKLLPGGSGLNNVEDLKEEERREFLNKLESLEDLDFILMDTGAGINRSVLAFISASDDTIVITNPEPTALTDAYSLIKAINHFDLKSEVNLIVNRIMDEEEGKLTFRKFHGAVNRFLNINIKLLGFIWEDRRVMMSVRDQKPFIMKYPNCHASLDIKAIAKSILNNGARENNKGSGMKEVFKKIFNIFS